METSTDIFTENCLIGDLAAYYKDMLAFFWLISRSEKIRGDVSPILEGYHTVERIAAEQNPSKPKIDIDQANADLVNESCQCGHRHNVLRFLYALQMPYGNSYGIMLAQRTRNYFDLWLQKRNEHTRR